MTPRVLIVNTTQQAWLTLSVLYESAKNTCLLQKSIQGAHIHTHTHTHKHTHTHTNTSPSPSPSCMSQQNMHVYYKNEFKEHTPSLPTHIHTHTRTPPLPQSHPSPTCTQIHICTYTPQVQMDSLSTQSNICLTLRKNARFQSQ